MYRNVSRRRWNNEKSTSVEQENHEYNQWAKRTMLRKLDKYPHREEYMHRDFVVGTHSATVHHA